MEVRPYIAIGGCFLIYLAIGTLVTFGNLTPYLTSYLKKKVKKDTTYEETSWIFYAFSTTSLLLYLGGKLGCVIGRRRIMIIGSCIFSFGIAVTYYSVQHSFVATIITYGVIDTLGFVCCFGHPVVTAIEWFPNKKGLVTGIVASGFALTPLFMNSVQTFFVNPRNLKPASDGFFYDDEIIENVPALFLVMGSINSGILLIGLLMYKESPRDSHQEETTSSELTSVCETSKQLRNKELSEQNTKDSDCRTTIRNEESSASLEEDITRMNVNEKQQHTNCQIELHMSPKEALKMKEFYLLSTVCICSFFPFMFLNAFFKTYGQTFIKDDTFLATTGSAAAAVHALFRVIVGLIQDKLSYKLTILLLLGVKTILLFSLVMTPYGGKMMYIIWICGIFATFPLIFVCIPAAVADVFGTTYTAEIFGMVFFTSSSSSFLFPLVFPHIIPLGWFVSFCVTATVSFIGLLVALLFPETHRTQSLISEKNKAKIKHSRYGAVEY